MHQSWRKALADEFEKPYFRKVAEFVSAERQERIIFPPPGEVFTAFIETPFDEVKVLILGQDPYHNAGQAHGLSFSVKPGVRPPPSLANIYQELADDLGVKPPKHGYLMAWAQRGVMLLNAVLTVQAHEPGSHQNKGWETFTDAVIGKLNARKKPVVFILWGRYARSKTGLISASRHTIIESPHPSPMSARSGFFGSKPFSKANAALAAAGLDPIDWSLPAQP